MIDTDFTEEQKQYLQGFAAGSGIATAFDDAGRLHVAALDQYGIRYLVITL